MACGEGWLGERRQDKAAEAGSGEWGVGVAPLTRREGANETYWRRGKILS